MKIRINSAEQLALHFEAQATGCLEQASLETKQKDKSALANQALTWREAADFVRMVEFVSINPKKN